MKKIIVFKIILLSCMFSYSQEFKMKLWFQDAVGNKDSIELGYDLLATDSIDSQYGETNSITTPWSNNFEVRISNEWKNRFNNNQSGTYHTKKQIVKKQLCSIPHSVTAIDIKAQHWPVTVSWDSTLNFTDCYNSSLLTSVMPYGWWDTPGFISLFANSSKKTFMPNELYFNNYYKYINEHYNISIKILEKDLNELTNMLRDYLLEQDISNLTKTKDISDIDYKITHVLSFNYTDTFRKICKQNTLNKKQKCYVIPTKID